MVTQIYTLCVMPLLKIYVNFKITVNNENLITLKLTIFSIIKRYNIGNQKILTKNSNLWYPSNLSNIL